MATATVEPPLSQRQVDTLRFEPRFPAAWAVPAAAATLRAAAGVAGTLAGPAPEGPSWYVRVAPGRLRIGSCDHARAHRTDERHLGRHGKLMGEQVAWHEAGEHGSEPLGRYSSRSRIVEWSGKSRRMMLE